MIDWNKPLRFKRVQGDDHANYRPRYVGKYINDRNQLRHVLVLRNWDGAASFIIYNDDGTIVDTAVNNESATRATGVFDANLENGDEISTEQLKVLGGTIELTRDGDKLVKVRLV